MLHMYMIYFNLENMHTNLQSIDSLVISLFFFDWLFESKNQTSKFKLYNNINNSQIKI